jgi:hypothetical protein
MSRVKRIVRASIRKRVLWLSTIKPPSGSVPACAPSTRPFALGESSWIRRSLVVVELRDARTRAATPGVAWSKGTEGAGVFEACPDLRQMLAGGRDRCYCPRKKAFGNRPIAFEVNPAPPTRAPEARLSDELHLRFDPGVVVRDGRRPLLINRPG